MDLPELARQLKVPYVDFEEPYPSMELLHVVPVELLVRYCCCPVQEKTDGTILLAMLDPGDHLALDDLLEITGRSFLPALASEVAIKRQLSRLNGTEEAISKYDSSGSYELPITPDCFDHTDRDRDGLPRRPS